MIPQREKELRIPQNGRPPLATQQSDLTYSSNHNQEDSEKSGSHFRLNLFQNLE